MSKKHNEQSLIEWITTIPRLNRFYNSAIYVLDSETFQVNQWIRKQELNKIPKQKRINLTVY